MKDVLREKSLCFAVRIVKLAGYLNDQKRPYVLTKQILRSGTSIGACMREAGSAESKADMAHKFAIAQKEADETVYWLELLFHSELLERNLYESLSEDALELLKLLRASIITLKRNRERDN